jgi:hypothetical protein
MVKKKESEEETEESRRAERMKEIAEKRRRNRRKNGVELKIFALVPQEERGKKLVFHPRFIR